MFSPPACKSLAHTCTCMCPAAGQVARAYRQRQVDPSAMISAAARLQHAAEAIIIMGLVVLDSKLQQEHRLTKRVVATKLLERHVMHGWAPQRSGHFGTARTCEDGQWTVDSTPPLSFA